MAEEPADLDPARLGARFAFLMSRAESHDEAKPGSVLHDAARATLLRDAACVALLSGDIGPATAALEAAGHAFLGLGLPAGAPLIVLADTGKATTSLQKHDAVFAALARGEMGDDLEPSGDEAPMVGMARASPRQMLCLMQAVWLLGGKGHGAMFDAVDAAKAVVDRNGGHPAGVTGLSVKTYEDAVEQMMPARGPSETALALRALRTIAATRAEAIAAARRDRYHWRLMPRPAELLDLDTVVLAVIAMAHGMAPLLAGGQIGQVFDAQDGIILAPIQAAAQLSGGNSGKPTPPRPRG